MIPIAIGAMTTGRNSTVLKNLNPRRIRKSSHALTSPRGTWSRRVNEVWTRVFLRTDQYLCSRSRVR
jgi:hypothetical protein